MGSFYVRGSQKQACLTCGNGFLLFKVLLRRLYISALHVLNLLLWCNGSEERIRVEGEQESWSKVGNRLRISEGGRDDAQLSA